jgi:transposase
VTHEDIVYDRRVRVIEYAARINNVSEACRVFGVSRKTYYEWVKKAEQYGMSALLPRERRRPHQPNAMTSEEVAVILSEAISRPTLGPKSLLRHLKKRGVDRSASGDAKILRRHNLGTAKQRVIALASLTATETGQLTEAALEGPLRVLPVRLPTRVRWWLWTRSTSGGSKVWARCGSSPRSTSRPGTRSSSSSWATRPQR